MTTPAPAVPAIRSLAPEQVELALDPAWFPFTTTAEVQAISGIARQPRALRAVEIGLGVRARGYNLYACGLAGATLLKLLQQFIAEHSRDRPTPPDWVYVNNFDEPDAPLALQLPPGQAMSLKRDMRALVAKIQEELPKAFRYEGFGQEKERLREEYEQRSRQLYGQLEELAKTRDLAVQTTNEGQLLFLPMKEGKSITPEESQQFTPEQVEEIGKRQQEVYREAQPILEQQAEQTKQLTEAIKNIEQSFAERLIAPLIEELSAKYQHERLTAWLTRVRRHMLDNLGQFRRPSGPNPPDHPLALLMMMGGRAPDDQPLEYDVNVLVDNGGVQGAPVLIEDAPTYKNLFGIVERSVDRFGRVATDFTRIKAGSVLRANGGYVLFSVEDALTEPLVWKELKRTLKSRRIHIDTYEPISFLSATGIKPEPIPLDVKVVLVGNGYLFHILNFLDSEFPELFKVKADFSPEMPLDAESCHDYARLVRRVTDEENLPPFDAAAVAELVRYGVRVVENRDKASAEFSELADLVREAGYWALHQRATPNPSPAAGRGECNQLITAQHVRQAIDERVYRSNRIAEKINELIQEGTLRITATGQAVGQVNGLSVIDLGDFAFGRPSRVTARAWVGRAGVINIERESRLSGKTHDKGMLIMEGYLRGKYAHATPLSSSASIAFEQSYSGIEGDSASAVELFCLLSAIAAIPLRQDIAVTGSVDQHGRIQAIGGVNEKVEGFYDVCRIHGLTGWQGVLIPHSNLQHLILRPDVVEAIRAGRFHLWTMETLDQGLTLLTGLPAGAIDQPNSVHGRVARRLTEIADALKESPAPAAERAITVQTDGTPPPPAPPPLPPQG